MADGKGESGAGLPNGRTVAPASSPLEPGRLVEILRELEDRLKEEEVSVLSSAVYCRRLCEVLLQCAEDHTASENLILYTDVYGTALRSFANARPYLTTECEDVLLLIDRLVLSCFEVILSMTEDDFTCDFGLQFKKSVLDSEGILIEFGHSNLQLLVENIKHDSAWQNPVLVKVLSRQTVEPEEVSNWISQEGPCIIQMRVKHLMKTNCIEQAMLLSKISSEMAETSSNFFFRQSFITCLCTMLPNEEAFKEISKMDGKDVLDTICNMESEGQVNAAFILCTTYLTQQLQNEITDFSWELTLFWSKLQRRIDPSLNTFLERCRQFGAIAKTCQHLFFLIKVVHTEAKEDGIPISITLCIRALQITSTEIEATKSSVCKTIACLLPDDLEVKRACQLTEFLFEPTYEGLNILEELFLQPDQKHVEESSVISNSLRCELLLALKSHWSFDPEFWAWKTLKRHCLKLLGKEVSDSDDSYGDPSVSEPDILNMSGGYDTLSEHKEEPQDNASIETESVKVKKPIGSSERYKRWLQYKFLCRICNREVIEARILHHARMHIEDDVYTCPVCVKKFKKKEVFVPHVMEHMKMPMRHRTKKKTDNFELKEEVDYEGERDSFGYISFRTIRDKNLQDRDVYPCPGTGCSRVFKQFKYLSIHLKAEHQNNDENAKHYLDLKNLREKCAFCRRHFISNFHLRQHTNLHLGPLPFMCVSIDCNERFKTINELLHHKQTHIDPQYKCELEGCHLVFGDLGLLYHHEAQHFRDAAYTCTFPRCKKFYYCRSEFQEHIATHVACSGDGLEDRIDLYKDLRKEQKRPFTSNCNYVQFAEDKILASGTRAHLLPEVLEERNVKYSSNAEICVYHGLSSDCTCKQENNGKVSGESLDKPMVKYMSDSDNLLNLLTSSESQYNTDVKEEQDKTKVVSETLDDLTNPETHIKHEHEEIPSSDSCQSSAFSEDTLFELLTSLKQLNLQTPNTPISSTSQGHESVASCSNNFAETQEGNNMKKEKGFSQYLSRLAAKPFACELLGCRSAFVTKDALLLHYCKKHQYTKENAMKLSMFQKKYAPFECHICQRHFSRRNLLRVHYMKEHQLSKEKTRSCSGKRDNKKLKSRTISQRRALCWRKFNLNEMNSSLKRTSSPQDDINSETCGDSLSDETDASNMIDAPRDDDFTLDEGRGSRRVVAQGKLCYILNKYHKPFHCIHKSCNASFTSQRGLVRHYQLVHQYNKESLCMEKVKEHKREFGKFRKIFTCKYKECRKSFICGRALAKHYKEFHEQSDSDDEEPNDLETENHLKTDSEDEESDETESDQSEIYCEEEGCTSVFSNHANYIRHIMSRHRKYNLYEGRRKRKKKEEDLDENYIEPKRCPRLIYKKKVKSKDRGTKKEEVEYKSREEALQMCAQNIDYTQFPCMIHGCSSVVKLESSIIRHYKLTHTVSADYVNDHLTELVYCVKNFPKGKEQSLSEDEHTPRLSLRSDNNRTANGRHESLRNSNGDLRRNGPVEISNFKDSDIRPFRKSEDRLDNSNEKENVSCTGFQAGCKMENRIGSQRQSVGSATLCSQKDDRQEQIQLAIGLNNFKPMGFESSFLKFLQESRDTDDEFEELEWNYQQKRTLQNSLKKRPCKDRIDQQISLSLGKSAASELTLQNLRTMLDKALSDCGDLALKQLHQLYQRPVVVLERSDFTSPLIDLFSNKKNDNLCVGIS
ncbi:zinc finger protein Rlf [Hyla sarda]|uniref:zinc finger protein Rlf n=1 Tax=Hyla sarda TaxID=327740 RepID=UPI0024C392A9|nr:zinc finger protein Rlf [Hyla sarda]